MMQCDKGGAMASITDWDTSRAAILQQRPGLSSKMVKQRNGMLGGVDVALGGRACRGGDVSNKLTRHIPNEIRSPSSHMWRWLVHCGHQELQRG
jgi:hypothetical protein